RDIVLGEGNLMVRKRFERKPRVIKDPLPVLGCDLPLLRYLLRETRGEVHASLTLSRYADFATGNEVDPLGFEGSVINPNLMPRFQQVLGPNFGPLSAPFEKL